MSQVKAIFKPEEKKHVAAIALLFHFRMLGLFMVLPILSVAINQRWGAAVSATLIGLSLGVYGLTQALLQIPFGLLSDRFGRKPLLLIGLALFAIGSMLAAYADTIYGLILGRALQGCGAIAGVLLAYLADLTSAKVRMLSMAFVGISIGASFLLALLIGPILFDSGGLELIFFISALLAVIGMLMVIVLLPSVDPAPSSINHIDLKHLSGVLRDIRLWHLNLGVFMIHALLTGLFLIVPDLLISYFEATFQQHWQLYLPVLLVSIIVALPVTFLTEKKQRLRLNLQLATGIMLIAFIALLIAINGHISMLMIAVALTLFFSGFNMLEASLPALVSRMATTYQRGTAMGLFSTSQFFGAFMGGSLGGLILQQWDRQMLVLVLALGLSLWFLSTWLYPKIMLQKTKTLSIVKNLSPEQVEQWCDEQADIMEAMYQPSDGMLYLKVVADEFDSKHFEQKLHQRFAVLSLP